MSPVATANTPATGAPDVRSSPPPPSVTNHLRARFAAPSIRLSLCRNRLRTQKPPSRWIASLSVCLGRTLLHPLSLTFPTGKVTGLIGHNGSGKSTLLKMLGRHQPPSAGEVLLDGQPLESWGSKAFARKVAYLPQQLPPAEGMTVRELVAIGRYPWHGALGRFGAADREKVEEAIALVGLKPLAHRLVDSLSGGERQRAWIAMLVAQDSRCLLLDEPTSALDIAHQVDVLALVHRLSQQRGLTVIAVLHDINMAARYCDYLVALRGGEMIAQGTPAELMRSDTLEQIYGIPMGILPHPAGAAPVSFVY
ncbi:Fe3+-hydroxamate ABC transporter ATP-binding protein FhuC [Klebsiella pneumoniae]|uniref:Fe3+-hydroxamate ABC transporter ATP-binding protein FhuC n=14 Tax=Gammaproteobacteria TaxID=1236 RepID=A0A927E344_KLEPN|nr:Fe3+-hydroxamate ABC transporter ATP-binding protein FhuC [Klebsiella pneumoniae]MBD3702216.1 Fe3+-hydroxamate ABC transporter ATP-binding protein FhuC [Klebsiella pneumoniae]MBD3704023.1 Fe3+-hydroxamate ABC transporter ATP-binding protein FhuC [Klebsiella pneumoniae]MBD3706227.1 Fe3+-hydroxamate ABC transporter ATP-binding protein FhuC [Klebsiella pneumoniae]MBD3707923.1 Fe3+-hydroxamate ABC transporter ATP-binding protein FhuC [Klebsiella pneumoniae]